MREKNLSNVLACFKLCRYTLTQKIIIAFTDVLNVNIALNLHSYEEN